MEFSKGGRKEASGDDRRQGGYRNWKIPQDKVELRRPHSAVSTNQPKPGWCLLQNSYILLFS